MNQQVFVVIIFFTLAVLLSGAAFKAYIKVKASALTPGDTKDKPFFYKTFKNVLMCGFKLY